MHGVDLTRKLQLLDQQIAEANEGEPADFEAWQQKTEVVLRNVLGTDSPILEWFQNNSYSPVVWTTKTDPRPYKISGVRRAISMLESAKVELGLQQELSAAIEPTKDGRLPEAGREIFIVHGHNDARKHEVARLLRDLTGEPPVILHEQADMGRVLLEKFEQTAARTGFAVVIATGDDIGRAQREGGSDRPRARQNVVFEMGFFFGALGRERTCVLLEEGVEEPGDVAGLVYVPLDGAGGWRSTLARNIHAAGIDIDWSALGRA